MPQWWKDDWDGLLVPQRKHEHAWRYNIVTDHEVCTTCGARLSKDSRGNYRYVENYNITIPKPSWAR